MQSRAASILSKIVRGRITTDEPLAKHTSFNIGGPADVWFEPTDAEDIALAVDFALASGIKTYVLGAGTNVLCPDDGIRGLVIHISRVLAGVRQDGDCWWVAAGEPLAHVAAVTVGAGYGGLEFGAGIPGSIGGGVVVNAGAYGRCLYDQLVSVDVVDLVGRISQINRHDIAAGYRWTSLDGAGLIVTGAQFELELQDREQLKRQVDDALRLRRHKHPLDKANAGSFFKNPRVAPAGELIDRAGLKGLSRGGAMISELHGNFFVNTGGATARDVLDLADVVREEIAARYGVNLELEVRLLGFDRDGAEV